MRSIVKTILSIATLLALNFGLTPATRAQAAQAKTPAASAPAMSPIQKTIDAYLRNLYAFGPDVILKVGPLTDTGIEGLLQTEVEVQIEGNKQSATLYVSKDGKYLLRGELADLTRDPLADNRAKIQIKDAPALGNPNASVTIVEFSDFECPVCRSLHDALRGLLPNYPQVRVIFKDFPIEQIHPWARTAALAGRCAYQQNPKAFWKLYDSIYDNQDLISPENAWNMMAEYADEAGLNVDNFKSCMASPEAGSAVDASRANGVELDVNSTPTIFVNGRRMVGADAHLLEQYIKYELDRRKPVKATTQP
jgi:protein-disulfide isomerase